MIFALVVLALTQVSIASQTAQAPPRDAGPVVEGAGIIRGRVVADGTGEPVRGCRVMLMTDMRPTGVPPKDLREAMMQPVFARTNDEGRYEFSKLAPGSYRVSAAPEMSSPRYVSPDLGRPWAMSFGKPLELSDGQKLEVPEIRLPRGSVLAGRVVDEFGEPVAHVRVNPLMRIGGGEPRQMGMSMGGTDDLGRFRLFGLRAGEYFLVADPQTFGPPGETGVRHIPTYLPSSLTLAEATPIRLRAGEEIGDLEIRLASGRTFTVGGSIVTSAGQPFSRRHGQVMFMEATAGGMTGRGVDLRDDGTFEVRGVKPGTYTIEIRPEMRHPDDDIPSNAEFGSAAVTVGSDDVKGITIVTQQGATVPGEVTFDEPRSDASHPLFVTATPASSRIMMTPPARAQVAPDGTFTLRGIFRPVYIRVSVPPGYLLASVHFERQDITDTPMEFKSGTTGRLSVTLTRRASELSGEVHDSKGPAASSFVFAFGEDRTLWTPSATTTKWVQSDGKGKYALRGLRPGRYLVVAAPLTSGPRMMMETEPDAWEALAKHATLVTIGDQERKTLDLKLVTELDR